MDKIVTTVLQDCLKMPGGTCAYVITNLVTGAFYIGCALDASAHIRRHYDDLLKGRHPNPKLQLDFTACAEKSSYVAHAMLCDDIIHAMEVEQSWLYAYRGTGNCLNQNMLSAITTANESLLVEPAKQRSTTSMKYYTWARTLGYEVSSKGDKRGSAFYATLPGGESIEHVYQTKVKGYASIKEGKGKPSKNKVNLFAEYLKLWVIYFDSKPGLLDELLLAAQAFGNCFSDCFANGNVNQARAIATIANDRIGGTLKYHYHVDGQIPQHSILVFGSNLSGVHGAGAALLAYEKYGAEIGIEEGLMDCCYAIPTISYLVKGERVQPQLALHEIAANVETFKRCALLENKPINPLKFFVTRIGCGLARYHDRDIAPMFRNSPPNCSFASQWQAYLE
jgi:hypothetical protein